MDESQQLDLDEETEPIETKTGGEKYFQGENEEEIGDSQFSFDLAKSGVGVASRKKNNLSPATHNDTSTEDIRSEAEGWLTVDVYETPTEIVVESAVAGVSPSDLDITATPDSVTIKGKRTRNREVKEENYLYQECYWGKFSRSVILPQEIDPESASVAFKDGILTIRLPKTMRHKTKRLEVSQD